MLRPPHPEWGIQPNLDGLQINPSSVPPTPPLERMVTFLKTKMGKTPQRNLPSMWTLSLYHFMLKGNHMLMAEVCSPYSSLWKAALMVFLPGTGWLVTVCSQRLDQDSGCNEPSFVPNSFPCNKSLQTPAHERDQVHQCNNLGRGMVVAKHCLLSSQWTFTETHAGQLLPSHPWGKSGSRTFWGNVWWKWMPGPHFCKDWMWR